MIITTPKTLIVNYIFQIYFPTANPIDKKLKIINIKVDSGAIV
jgi:hypothetical protein